MGNNIEPIAGGRSDIPCPSCGSKQSYPFYEVRNVPVHSCLMMPSSEEARRFPRGDIVLGFCRDCGFITNLAYDPAFQNYSSIYEDQQSFSPTFNSFARNLAQTLVKKYNLYEKDILEIGCGKGDFLALLCELGNNRGVGIDPAGVKERIVSEAFDQIEIIPDYYSEKYSDYTGDFVLCRHTLEHIHPTAQFLSTLRGAIDGRLDTAVFFEIPEAIRVLREQAFWDIYYEHCSHFSPGSVARLFRHCG
ncbi:MAG: class I SAM-dependent methyltransferase, partial [Candidatus Zixiibacteriota bacterium]